MIHAAKTMAEALTPPDSDMSLIDTLGKRWEPPPAFLVPKSEEQATVLCDPESTRLLYLPASATTTPPDETESSYKPSSPEEARRARALKLLGRQPGRHIKLLIDGIRRRPVL